MVILEQANQCGNVLIVNHIANKQWNVKERLVDVPVNFTIVDALFTLTIIEFSTKSATSVLADGPLTINLENTDPSGVENTTS